MLCLGYNGCARSGHDGAITDDTKPLPLIRRVIVTKAKHRMPRQHLILTHGYVMTTVTRTIHNIAVVAQKTDRVRNFIVFDHINFSLEYVLCNFLSILIKPDVTFEPW